MSGRRNVSRAAVTLVGLAGIAWVLQAVAGEESGVASDAPTYLAGLLLFGLGLAAFGYSLVTTAPVWLRAVVVLATPALGYAVWISLWDGVQEARDTLLLLSGLVLLAAAVLGLAAGERRAAATGRTTGGHAAG